MTEISVIRYESPVLLVNAVSDDGKTIKGFQAKIKYAPGREPQGDTSGTENPAGDVLFESQDDGRWRTSQLLPDEEFTVSVEAQRI